MSTQEKIQLLKTKRVGNSILVPKNLLRDGVIEAAITERNGMAYLLERFENGERKLNGRPIDVDGKGIRLPDCGVYVRYQGEIYVATRVKNHIGYTDTYDVEKLGKLVESVTSLTLNGKKVHGMVNSDYDCLVQDYEDFEAGKRNKGEYNEANRILAIMKKNHQPKGNT